MNAADVRLLSQPGALADPVLVGFALVWLLSSVTLAAAMLACLVEWLDRRRLRWVAAQVEVTDAIHRSLGAIVAPTVVTRRGGLRAVRMGLGPRERAVAGRLADVAWQSLKRDGAPVPVVFVPRRG
jgi:hypothetical protein